MFDPLKGQAHLIFIHRCYTRVHGHVYTDVYICWGRTVYTLYTGS
jgi:hypothetical protein